MEEEYKKYYYKFRMSMPLELKIGYSRKRIRDFYNQMNGDVYVSFSGGKDSTVLYHLVKQEYPKVKAIFVDTGVEFPEIRQFVRENKEVEVIRPDTTFKEVCEKYGYPVVSKEQSNYIGEV
jgi:3'-phosphoadenosine 5'-phosphosulfate sulfotransferase (PAPS reductase)/FAD synthetase